MLERTFSAVLAWPRQFLLAAAVLFALVFTLYAHVLAYMAQTWWTNATWSYGFLVPVFSGWVVWRERRRWLDAGGEGSWLGLLGVAAAIMLLVLGSLAAELSSQRFSFVVLLASLVLLVGGWKRLRILAFPLAYLVLMIPWPTIVYAQVTLPLEFLATRWAAVALRLVQVPVLREGNLLVLPNYTLQVAVACSGIRSLVSFVALAIAYVYLAEHRTWLRITLVALMVPVAVVSNSFRIFGTGVLTAEVSPGLAHGFFHEFSGWLIFLAAAVLMLVLHRILQRAAEYGERRRG